MCLREFLSTGSKKQNSELKSPPRSVAYASSFLFHRGGYDESRENWKSITTESVSEILHWEVYHVFSINGNFTGWKQLFREKLEYISKDFTHPFVLCECVRLTGGVSDYCEKSSDEF